MSNVVKMPRKVRPLKATYNPAAPYLVEREDADEGGINYDVVDSRHDSFRLVCCVPESGHAKHDAEQIAAALNLRGQYGLDVPPKMKLK